MHSVIKRRIEERERERRPGGRTDGHTDRETLAYELRKFLKPKKCNSFNASSLLNCSGTVLGIG